MNVIVPKLDTLSLIRFVAWTFGRIRRRFATKDGKTITASGKKAGGLRECANQKKVNKQWDQIFDFKRRLELGYNFVVGDKENLLRYFLDYCSKCTEIPKYVKKRNDDGSTIVVRTFRCFGCWNMPVFENMVSKKLSKVNMCISCYRKSVNVDNYYMMTEYQMHCYIREKILNNFTAEHRSEHGGILQATHEFVDSLAENTARHFRCYAKNDVCVVAREVDRSRGEAMGYIDLFWPRDKINERILRQTSLAQNYDTKVKTQLFNSKRRRDRERLEELFPRFYHQLEKESKERKRSHLKSSAKNFADGGVKRKREDEEEEQEDNS